MADLNVGMADLKRLLASSKLQALGHEGISFFPKGFCNISGISPVFMSAFKIFRKLPNSLRALFIKAKVLR